nr:putative rhamnogalacturonate lyase c [Quercus suber]
MALNAILHRKRSSWWQRLQQAPCSVLAQTLYAARQRIAASTLSSTAGLGITVVCISDTHNMTPELPPGDLLIHAGDLTQGGTAAELQTQLDWLDAQPHRHKVVIAGNHDIVLDEEKSTELGVSHHRRQSLRWGSIVYLERSRSWYFHHRHGQIAMCRAIMQRNQQRISANVCSQRIVTEVW